MRSLTLYKQVERKIGVVFESYGRFVYSHAPKIIIISIIINGACAIGIVNMKWEIDAKKVYLPQETQTRKDKSRVEKIFPDMSGSMFNVLQVSDEGFWARVIVKSKSGNLLNRTILEEIGYLSNMVLNITAENSDGSVIKFSDICAINNNKCSVVGNIFWDEEFLTASDEKRVTFPSFISSRGIFRYSSSIGGNVTTDESGRYLTSMEYLKLDYMIRTDDHIFEHLGKIWADEFKEKLSTYRNEYFDIAYGHFNSISEEIDRTIFGDMAIFVGTLTMMVVYACIATVPASLQHVGDRIWLGMAGILAAGLAIPSSFGLCAAAGVDFVSIVGAAPFLVIGIGIDDMFILLAGLYEARRKPTLEEKISDTLRTSGVGITITTVTDLIAFMAGAGTNIIAVRSFCTYAGLAVLFCYINNVTFFAACMVINEKRIANNHHFITFKRRLKNRDALHDEISDNTEVNEYPKNFIDKFVHWIIPKIVLKFPNKIIIIILFAGYISASIYGCTHLKQGLLFSQIVNDDSYFFKLAHWNEQYFPRQYTVAFVIPDVLDYSDPKTFDMINDVIKSVQSNIHFDPNFEVNWLKAYRGSPYYNGSLKSTFIAGLKNFTNDKNYATYQNDIIFNRFDSSVKSSRFYALSANLPNSQEEGRMMLEARDIANTASVECIAYSPFFEYFEQYVCVLGLTLKSIGITFAAVFVITCMFMPHPVLVTLVTLVVVVIMIGVFGVMYYLDIALSAVTMIQLIMTVGFAIDFSAHICHGYMVADNKNANARVKETIERTGAPILHGALSSILGISLLISAKSFVFRTFQSIMFFVLFFGITHALFLVPVILPWVWPSKEPSAPKQLIDNCNQILPLTDKTNVKNGSPSTCYDINSQTLSLDVEEVLKDINIRETVL
ncbi:patched domain-containing protein 3-like [Mercenaria mercenaria]|uniref:patched domain-containing protein 3-like n=1 Tax=Mercenaria mercenaria TaxID=6596 RepID=UPI00234ECEAA|nr:patched domain-containing protein 3-like [Mercenaria mercenaria]XP_053403812.1 patched domain-containing protein 3-like [Mercenaria mercenaria]